MLSITRTLRLCQCNVRNLTVPAARRSASTKVSKPRKTQSTSLAKKLEETGLWKTTRGRKPKEKADEDETKVTKRKTKAKPKAGFVSGDKTRVNIVSEQLCSDITKYIGPTLERHVGCDILDLNPGAGVWSRQLNDVLKPRSHILMEPDAKLYEPFLKTLLSRQGTRLIPQSGILWKELNEAMTFLEYQKEEPDDLTKERKRNDTLLVTANLCSYPKRRYRTFESLAILVLFQLVTSIRSSALFQKYGLIRMMIWVNDEDKRAMLPRHVQKRNKSALDAELSCEWLAEVAGKDASAGPLYESEQLKKASTRDHALDIQSSQKTLKRMAASNIEIIPDRLMDLTKEAMETEEDLSKISGANYQRPWIADLHALQEAHAAGKIAPGTAEHKRLIARKSLMAFEGREASRHAELLGELDDLRTLYNEGSKKLAESIDAYNESVEQLSMLSRNQFRLTRNNAHVFRQDPPVMLWDRRPWEPLKAEPEEFFPQNHCALLDIQPKSMHPLLRSGGNAGDRPSDIMDLIHRALADESRLPISKSLEKLWPGALEGILPHCPSLTDPAQGGLPGTGHAELNSRVLNEKQWMEILDAFLKWPFRPTYAEMVGRLADDVESSETGPSIDTGLH